MRSLESIKKECQRHAINTGRKTFAVDVGADGLLCPIFVTAGRVERGEKILCEAEPPENYGKKRAGAGALAARVAQLVTYLETAKQTTKQDIQKELGITSKQAENLLYNNRDVFVRVAHGVWSLRTPGIAQLDWGGRGRSRETVAQLAAEEAA